MGGFSNNIKVDGWQSREFPMITYLGGFRSVDESLNPSRNILFQGILMIWNRVKTRFHSPPPPPPPPWNFPHIRLNRAGGKNAIESVTSLNVKVNDYEKSLFCKKGTASPEWSGRRVSGSTSHPPYPFSGVEWEKGEWEYLPPSLPLLRSRDSRCTLILQ